MLVPKQMLDRYLRPRIVRVRAPLSITRAKLECDEAGKHSCDGGVRGEQARPLNVCGDVPRRFADLRANAFLTGPGYIFLPNRA